MEFNEIKNKVREFADDQIRGDFVRMFNDWCEDNSYWADMFNDMDNFEEEISHMNPMDAFMKGMELADSFDTDAYYYRVDEVFGDYTSWDYYEAINEIMGNYDEFIEYVYITYIVEME